jgi:hypothetical protein
MKLKLKKTGKITLVLVAVLVVAELTLPRLTRDGSIPIRTQITVVDLNDQPIENAEVRMTKHDGTEVSMVTTDASGYADTIVLAGWGTGSSLLHARHTASVHNVNYTVSKDGYLAARLEFPQTRFRWHEFLGVEIGRPRLLELRCILEKTDGQPEHGSDG